MKMFLIRNRTIMLLYHLIPILVIPIWYYVKTVVIGHTLTQVVGTVKLM